MKDLERRMQVVERIIRIQIKDQEMLAELARSTSSDLVETELQADLRQSVSRNRERLRHELVDAANFPPRHARHFELLKDFWEVADYERSVFVMSKFPEDETAPKDVQLEALLATVSEAVTAAGFTPRLARGTGAQYHPALWDNVELHMLGCSRGIAIVEDRYLSEMNPNVAMEWGWLRSMGKPVLFLVEDEFAHFRADMGGLIEARFAWDDPGVSVSEAVGEWLGK